MADRVALQKQPDRLPSRDRVAQHAHPGRIGDLQWQQHARVQHRIPTGHNRHRVRQLQLRRCLTSNQRHAATRRPCRGRRISRGSPGRTRIARVRRGWLSRLGRGWLGRRRPSALPARLSASALAVGLIRYRPLAFPARLSRDRRQVSPGAAPGGRRGPGAACPRRHAALASWFLATLRVGRLAPCRAPVAHDAGACRSRLTGT